MATEIFKFVHIIMAYAAFTFLLLRAFPILIQSRWQEKSTTSNKIFVALQHLSYSILVLSGLWLLWKINFQFEAWFYAKIILFVVVLSASAKAFKRRPDMLLIQRQAGLTIAIVAYFAIFGLVLLKPLFG
ncbi:SirB2 family protein [Acinetobacter puyangensis]|uniref:Invasion gene expression up-regulator, SirB n=1 Tax=Acinetobacter puyangensis TaxID=1096779 RepID=A0A240EDE1_9GAMM|nr:SirB2 family protein [Acinetobacter puyangensis]SNX46576.1 Invasion gene expression up-regulator, SirB [Acinetobacter puyangensis]